MPHDQYRVPQRSFRCVLLPHFFPRHSKVDRAAAINGCVGRCCAGRWQWLHVEARWSRVVALPGAMGVPTGVADDGRNRYRPLSAPFVERGYDPPPPVLFPMPCAIDVLRNTGTAGERTYISHCTSRVRCSVASLAWSFVLVHTSMTMPHFCPSSVPPVPAPSAFSSVRANADSLMYDPHPNCTLAYSASFSCYLR